MVDAAERGKALQVGIHQVADPGTVNTFACVFPGRVAFAGNFPPFPQTRSHREADFDMGRGHTSPCTLVIGMNARTDADQQRRPDSGSHSGVETYQLLSAFDFEQDASSGGYYEWPKDVAGKIPTFLHGADGGRGFAGLFGFWCDHEAPDGEPGEWLMTATILTWPEADALGHIYDCTLVIVPQSLRYDWLDLGRTGKAGAGLCWMRSRTWKCCPPAGQGRGQHAQQRTLAHRTRLRLTSRCNARPLGCVLGRFF